MTMMRLVGILGMTMINYRWVRMRRCFEVEANGYYIGTVREPLFFSLYTARIRYAGTTGLVRSTGYGLTKEKTVDDALDDIKKKFMDMKNVLERCGVSCS